jgi:hypothetical protein
MKFYNENGEKSPAAPPSGGVGTALASHKPDVFASKRRDKAHSGKIFHHEGEMLSVWDLGWRPLKREQLPFSFLGKFTNSL